MNKFKCEKCGSHELSYLKFVSCEVPVIIESKGHITYEQSKIDQDDEVIALSGYVCGACNYPMFHCGIRIQTEKDLINLLTMDPDKRKKEEGIYLDTLEAEIERDLEEQEMINESYVACNEESVSSN